MPTPLQTDIYTIFTTDTGQAGDPVYSALTWVRITMTLQTAGPVSIGTRAELSPVLGGKGVLLTPNVPYTVVLNKGNRLYMASESINRISFTVESLAYGDEIVGSIHDVESAVKALKPGQRTQPGQQPAVVCPPYPVNPLLGGKR